jgi:hypothetical protein
MMTVYSWRNLFPHALFSLVAFVVWFPGGFSIGPYQKEDIAIFALHGPGNQILDDMVTRSFRDVPVWLGTHITPHSFMGWQVALLLMTILHASLIFEIIRRIAPGFIGLALCCGLLAAFNPADSGYFLLNTTGSQFSLVFALASCLLAIMHLQSGSKGTLAGMWIFQLLAGFTYPGYFLWMVAIPVGAWIVCFFEGKRPRYTYFIKLCSVLCFIVVFDIWMMRYVGGWDAHVADVNFGRAVSGYLWAISHAISSIPALIRNFRVEYCIFLAAALIVAIPLIWAIDASDEAQVRAPRMPKSQALIFFLGLIAIALISYAPYSITIERFADRRQLYGLGIFGFGAFLFLIFFLIEPWRHRRIVGALLVGSVALVAVASGLEKRSNVLDRYRSVETLLSAVATAIPNPPTRSLILVQIDQPCGWRSFHSIYRHQNRFTILLDFMYGDQTLVGAMLPPKDNRGCGSRSTVTSADDDDDSDTPRSNRRVRMPDEVAEQQALTSLAVAEGNVPLRYGADGTARILGPDEWLRLKKDYSLDTRAAYAVPEQVVGTPRANVCKMLEREFQPGYCSD